MKVMIVDDEKMLRIGLNMMIPWEEHGYELCGGAEDGLAALGMIDWLEPDIVITDLRMPRMDGLELIQELRSRPGFRGKIIALSNYDEYALVREALKLGALDYLLKVTLKAEELLAVLGKTRELILAERQEQEADRIRTEAVLEGYRLSKNHFFQDLVNGEPLSDSELARQASRLKIEPGERPLFLLYLHVDRYDRNKWSQKQLMSFSIRNIVSELMTGLPVGEFAEIAGCEYMVLLSGQGRYASDSGKMQLAKQIADMLRMYLNLEVNVVVSEPFAGLRHASRAYRACNRAAGIRFYLPAPVVMHAGESGCHDGSLPPPIVRLQDDMIARIRSGETCDLADAMEALLEAAGAARLHPSLLARSALTVIDCWEAAGAGTGGSGARPGTYRDSLAQAGTAGEFRAAFAEALRYLERHAPLPAARKYRKEVRGIIEYLLEHIDRKITLEAIARHVNLNENHMSRLFKNETGQTIVGYLNGLRMERARELLKNPDLSVKAVAEDVGIPDPFYFNRLFRKLYGLSPTDYKKQALKNQNRP
ncbi:hypothetical protein QJ48_03380 [Paenibacillus sp. A3]|uniref:helix-turn-helix domain-containing protein n=1 Tax=Paenibacillus sp. A3 TaxID=1337054 RepID=UPI0006D58C35|nr:helix-turn-helix domain-containing protein [Paenibacillus sp. A3]KPV60825.1 hypothetical protein QJ48_03380 [Paenibacillus sp. A3]